jgi:hypothetical protein
MFHAEAQRLKCKRRKVGVIEYLQALKKPLITLVVRHPPTENLITLLKKV